MTKLRLKKKYREGLQNIGLITISVLAIFLCGLALQAQDNKTRKDAIERCGGENNIVERYTNQGDLFLSCKVEK